jgi:hypothetical protein
VRVALADCAELFPWALTDVHAVRWTDGGRMALLGDAAGVPAALERYVARVRRVAERHQRESRRFGRVMMIDSRLGAHARDTVLRHVSASRLLSGVIATTLESASSRGRRRRR